jgi:hypothetical protein
MAPVEPGGYILIGKAICKKMKDQIGFFVFPAASRSLAHAPEPGSRPVCNFFPDWPWFYVLSGGRFRIENLRI